MEECILGIVVGTCVEAPVRDDESNVSSSVLFAVFYLQKFNLQAGDSYVRSDDIIFGSGTGAPLTQRKRKTQWTQINGLASS